MNRSLLTLSVLAAIALAACSTTSAPPQQPAEPSRGIASWYGQEYAGRTTANGEIFDPMQLTAAHRTLPFGTVVDVTNLKTNQTVRVRINDRGPYINDRMIDLSYAAAQKIGLIEPGSGTVDLAVVKLGKGDREPPAPYIVTVPELKPIATPAAAEPTQSPVAAVPVVVENVQVVEEHNGVETRRQVSPDGKRIETVPVTPPKVVEAAPAPAAPASPQPPPPQPAPRRPAPGFVVQVGAFAQEPNAKLLVDQLAQLGEKAYVEHLQLFHVRIGPFGTREEAVRMRTKLESAGLSAIVIAN